MSTKIPFKFIQGADSDSDNRAITAYRGANNSILGVPYFDANLGAVVNPKGNTLIPYPAITPSMGCVCVNTTEDIENDAIIYCIYNPNGNHFILRYNIIQQTIDTILSQKINALWTIDGDLAFDPNHPITSAWVIQGLFYWQQDNVPPRKININKAIGYTNNPIWNFSDNNYYTNTGITNYGMVIGQPYVALVFSATTMPNNLIVGSLINVQQYPVAAGVNFNPQYNGVATVAIIDNVNYKIITNIPWGISTPTEPGNISLFVPNIYSIINEQVIDRAKWPPLASPLASYQNDYTNNYNNLRGSTFQFAYAYVYDDNEQTVQSPISKLPIPSFEELIDGTLNPDAHVNNRLDIVIDTNIDTIKSILIYGRSNADETGTNPVTVSANNGEWYLIDRIERYDENGNYILDSNGNILLPQSSQYTYQFFNDKIKDIVDQDRAEDLFDYVPQFVGASELIEKNRILDGDIIEGYDNVDIDVELNLGINYISYPAQNVDIPIPQTTNNLGGVATYGGVTYSVLVVRYTNITLPPKTSVNIGDTFRIQYTANTINNSSVITSQNYEANVVITQSLLNNYPTSVITELQNQIYPQVVCHIQSPFVLSIVDNNWIPIPSAGNYFIYATSISAFILRFQGGVKVKTWKTGAKHPFGVKYYDRANRSGAVNVDNKPNPSTIVYVPFPTEYENGGQESQGKQWVINWKIKHKPPVWATHYQWVYGGSNIQSFLQYQITPLTGYNSAFPVTDNKNGIYQDSVTGIINLNFGQALLNYEEEQPASILNYVWQKGDRCRFLLFTENQPTSWSYFSSSSSAVNGAYLPVSDFEILGWDSATGILKLNSFDITQFTGASFGPIMQNCVVEVYTPKMQLSAQEFFEIGECYDIGDAGLPTAYHKGGDNAGNTDQNISTGIPATGTFDSGDVYLKLRFTQTNILSPVINPNFHYFPCESIGLSDVYISDSYDKGRPSVVDRNMKQRRLQANMRVSYQLVQDTQINGLSQVQPLDAQDNPMEAQMPDKFGAIMGLVEVADVVKIIQQKKCSSMYVGRNSTGEADGTSTVYVTGGILGTILIPPEIYGTKDKTSICRWQRNLYFWDLDNGVFVRNAANGSYPISNYGQKNYFREWRDEILFALKQIRPKYRVLTAYDKMTESVIVTLAWEYYVPVINNNSDQLKLVYRQETIAFLESVEGMKTDWSDAWKSNYSFTPEYYGYASECLLSFMNGQLWLHHSNNIRNNFYSKQAEQTITFVVNLEPDTIKRLLAISQNTNQPWYVKSIVIPPSANYPQGMASSILATKFVAKEGIYYADFNKDSSDPRFTTTLDALLNGRDLRGFTAEITLGNQYPSEVVLYDALVTLIPTPKSGVK